jgi:hypothetical protein
MDLSLRAHIREISFCSLHVRLEFFFYIERVRGRDELEEARHVGVSSPSCTCGIKSPNPRLGSRILR